MTTSSERRERPVPLRRLEAASCVGKPGPPRTSTRRFFNIGLYAGLGLIAAYICLKVFTAVDGVALQILFALVAAAGLSPVVEWLTEHHVRRGVAVALTLITVSAALTCAIILALTPLIHQLMQLMVRLSHADAQSRAAANPQGLLKLFDWLQAHGYLLKITNGIADNAVGAGSVLAGGAIQILTTVIFTAYLLTYFDQIIPGAVRLAPPAKRKHVEPLLERAVAQVGRYTGGAVLVASQAAITAGLFSELVGLPYPIAIAVGAGSLDLVPIVGPLLAGLLITAIGLTHSTAIGIISAAFYTTQHLFESYWLHPRVMRRAVRVPALAVIIAVLVGSALFGIAGAALAVPITAAMYALSRGPELRKLISPTPQPERLQEMS